MLYVEHEDEHLYEFFLNLQILWVGKESKDIVDRIGNIVIVGLSHKIFNETDQTHKFVDDGSGL